ncbi:MAG: hypothetical protein JNM90_13830 [Burkholderiales bacterium]|nr:hypothetical protein [Burkholderiales bacterium]
MLLALGGCSGARLWPFGAEEGRPAVPENAVRYACDGNRGFYLRMLAGGDAWVILPEREFRLDRVGGATGRRFTNGVAVLDLGPDAASPASLTDGPAAAFGGCKPAAD